MPHGLNKEPIWEWKNSGLVNWYLNYDKTTLRPMLVRGKNQQASKDDVDDEFRRMQTVANLKKDDSHEKSHGH